MKKNVKMIAVLGAVFTMAFGQLSAQSGKVFNAGLKDYMFSSDSLDGFDEQAASVSAISEGFVGAEYPVRMWQLKRTHINNKYGLWPVKPKSTKMNYAESKVAVPACTNEDFEASVAAPLTGINQIAGWSVTSGQVNWPNNFCNLPAIVNAPYQGALIDCPSGTGFIDPVIGGVYPIYSVFGGGANNGNPINPQVTFPMGGTKIIRINNQVNNYSVEKLSKTFAVTPSNAVFQFAFMSVFSTGHQCCDASSFKINVSVGGNTLSCPAFSVSAPSSQCTTVTPIPYYLPISGNPYTGSGGLVFSKWVVNSLDLTQYIGQNVTLDMITADCNAGGHYAYCYIDAQCLPMNIIGNGQGFPAGTPSITLPTCGAAGATITAPPGLGPYSWNSGQISIPAPLTVPNNTNTTLVTGQSGTVLLTMNPPGSCAPITKVITVSITPAPIALITATQPGCTSTLAIAQLTTAGSASVNPTITWSPTPGSISGNSLTGTGLPIGITTVVVQDPLGCKVTLTVNILPAPPPVTFTINNLTGSSSITCINPTINLQAVSNYTYGTLNYFWSSLSFTANTTTVGITAANTITVTATDPATGCFTTQVITISIFTTAPTNSVNPTSQAITCNSGAPVTFSEQ